jgi:arginine decarboxylase
MLIIPERMFLTKGVGRHREKLQSLELALRRAGIAHLNIVRVSSIFPPGCKIVSRQRSMSHFRPGQIVYAVMSECATNEPNRLLAASIGVAIPAESHRHGYLSEHHAFGQTERKAGDYAEDLAATMLATTLGIPFDPDEAWDQRKKVYMMAGKIVRTRSITQSATCDKRGLWTTVIAAVVFLAD